MAEQQYIWIDDWETFQHYKDRNPPWIKNYTELLGHDDYLDLSSHRRGVLHGIWLAYATGRRRLTADTRSLSARLNARVTTADLQALTHAGFIEIIASSALAARLQTASARVHARGASARSQEAEAERPEGYLSADGPEGEPADEARRLAGSPRPNGKTVPAITIARLRLTAVGHELPPGHLHHELADALGDRIHELTDDDWLDLRERHADLIRGVGSDPSKERAPQP